MNPTMKCSVLCSILLLMFLNAGPVECSGLGTISFPKEGIHAYSRKLLEFSMLLDYDYAGPNPKHEPRGKKGGGGGGGGNRNP